MTELPDGLNRDAILAAISWEIVKKIYLDKVLDLNNNNYDDAFKDLVNHFIDSYHAMIKLEPIKKG